MRNAPRHVTRRSLAAPLLFAFALLAAVALAIQTPEVELGNGGLYDGRVKIRRDEQGRMLLSDNQVTTAVTLNDLRFAGRDHGLQLGLGDDDHPQYQNAARHAATHAPAFNGALATPPDLGGNATLGAHLLDPDIHLKRAAAESIPGAWQFLAAPAFTRGLNLTGGAIKIAGTDAITTTRVASLAQVNAGSLRLDGNTISSVNPGGNILLAPDGSGKVGVGLASAPVSLLHVGGDMTLGVNGGGDRSITSYSSSPGKYCQLATSDNQALLVAYGGIYAHIASSAGAVWLSSGLGQGMFMDWGDALYMRDRNNGNATRVSIDAATGDINNYAGAYKTGGTTRLAADGAATLTRADIDNLRLDGNTLSSLNANGPITLSPNGSGQVAVTGDLAVGSGSGKITLNGQRLATPVNLLDNPDFDIWQRNISQTCAAGGNAAGTILWPVPGTLSTGADRWQVSRAKTDQSSVISRAVPPVPLPTALYCLKNEYVAGAECSQFIHQAVPREVTAALRGKWVTFAVSHYLSGAGGGNIAIYKMVGGVPTPLSSYAFTATPNAWDRLAVAAQVPADAEVLCVSVRATLAAGGPSVSCLANAALVEGKLVNGAEKVTDPPASSLPPVPRRPAENLEACQRYCEKGTFCFSFFATEGNYETYYQTIPYNTAKASSPTITLSNLNLGALHNSVTESTHAPEAVPGQAFPQAFRFAVSGILDWNGPVTVNADWLAVCPEPI